MASEIIRVNRGLIAETGIIPAGLHFIRDSHSFRPIDTKKSIAEGKDGKEISIFKVTGLFQEADKQNANGRVYPRSVLATAVEEILKDAERRAVMGEFDHPPDAKIHLDRVSHLITKVWMDGKKVYGEAEVLDAQPYGRCLRGLFEQKVNTGISSRGVGDMEVRESGGQEFYEVLEGYSFVTWDAVAEPSVHGAQLRPVAECKQRLRPIHHARKRGQLSESAYNRALLAEIDRFFGING
jgi:hypothetical protein